jgi:hypothetical protein
MRLITTLLILLTTVGCASRQSQQVLRNQPPFENLNMAVEVIANGYLGWGAMINGNRILTAFHITNGNTNSYWRRGAEKGTMTFVRAWEERDLVLYAVDQRKELLIGSIELSDYRPFLGEELYWNTHTSDARKGLGRGFVISVGDNKITVNGWFHPGTSGSPVLRADGTVVGIATSGSNWACVEHYGYFKNLAVEDKLDCLFRMSMFNSEMVVVDIVGLLE